MCLYGSDEDCSSMFSVRCVFTVLDGSLRQLRRVEHPQRGISPKRLLVFSVLGSFGRACGWGCVRWAWQCGAPHR